MENVSYVGLSQQIALQREMEVTANNIANMNTSGYKTEGILFQQYLNKASPGDDGAPLKQVEDYGTFRDLSAGSLKQTFNQLDFGIEGQGYFAVQTPAGTRYTRDGAFSLNSNNEIVTSSGAQVQGEGGTLTIPQDASIISLGPDGTLSTDKGIVGKIKVVTFANAQALKAQGSNLFDSGGQAETAADAPHIEQGMLESSNVNPIVEMNRMIQVSRMYDAAQNMVMNDHQRILDVIQKLSQVS